MLFGEYIPRYRDRKKLYLPLHVHALRITAAEHTHVAALLGPSRCRGGKAAAQHISGCFASVSAHSRPRPCSLLRDLISPVAAAVQNLIPSTRESIVAGDALGDFVALLLALAVVAFVVIILHGIIRASQHFRDLKLEAKEANAEIEQQRMDHVAGLERKMAAPFVPNDDHAAI